MISRPCLTAVSALAVLLPLAGCGPAGPPGPRQLKLAYGTCRSTAPHMRHNDKGLRLLCSLGLDDGLDAIENDWHFQMD